MSLFLPKLSCKKDLDEIIKTVAEKVLVLRFGRDEDSVCMQLDEIVSRVFYYLLCYNLTYSRTNLCPLQCPSNVPLVSLPVPPLCPTMSLPVSPLCPTMSLPVSPLCP
ncbi:thioredoxin-like protein 4B, partial [Tachysurus ichikawai]